MLKHGILTTVLVLVLSQAFGQPTKAYIDQFNEAKLHLANHKFDEAMPLLEELWEQDRYNGNLNYLLGLCYIKMDKKNDRTVELLELAEKSFSRDYDPSSYKERNAPEYVYYYQIIAYSRAGECKKALNTLNKFYGLYSYEDEFYLIDGQKWVRECGPQEEEKKEEPAPALVEAEPEPEPQRPMLEHTTEMPVLPPSQFIDPAEEAFAQRPVQTDNRPIPSVAIDDKSSSPPAVEPEIVPEITYGPVLRERLVRVKDGPPDVRSREVRYTTYSSLYGVQVGSFIKPKYTTELPGLKNVEVYVDRRGVYRYVVGRFNHRKQAETLLDLVKQGGYPDAFIVDLNGEAQRFTEEVVTLDNQSIKRKLQGRVNFRVQVGAFSEFIEENVAQSFLEVDNITAMTQGSLTILTVGEYATYEEAAAQRERIKDLGFDDAYVVAFNYNVKIPVREAQLHVQGQQNRMAGSEEKSGRGLLKSQNKENDEELEKQNAMEFRKK